MASIVETSRMCWTAPVRETLPLHLGYPFRVLPPIGGDAPDAELVSASECATCA